MRIRTFFMTAVMFAAVACGSTEQKTVNEIMSFATDLNANATSAAQTATFSFRTNCAWNIDIPSDVDWLTLDNQSSDKPSATRYYSVTASIKENSGDVRTASLTLNYGTKGFTKTLTITQQGKNSMKFCTVENITDDILFSTTPAATSTAVQQGFDFSEDFKYMFYSQINSSYKNILSRVTRVAVTSSVALATDKMTLLYFSHGNNIHYEKGSDGATYIWLGNYGTVQSDGKYNQPQVLSRVKFVPGTTLRSVDVTDNYYFGTHNIHASFDEANDQLAIFSQADGYTMKIYKLSDVLALPVTDVTLAYPITYGGESGNTLDPAATTVTPTIKARDCRTLKPLYTFTYNYPGNGRGWQTYCIYNNKAYFFIFYSDTTRNLNGMAYRSVIDAIDYTGKIVKQDILQPFADNVEDLVKYGFTDVATKYMENEGIIIRDGVLYLMYTGKNAAGFRRPIVFNFDASNLE